MISTVRGLAILAAIAVVFGVLVTRTLGRGRPEPIDRAIVPGLDPDRLTELSWDRSPLPAISVVRQDSGWIWRSTGGSARADSMVIRDVLAALRGAHWHRRAEVEAAGVQAVQLTLTVGTVKRVIGIGSELGGTEQAWLVVGDQALLVDRWVTRALAPEPLALRQRRLVSDASGLAKIAIGGTGSRIQFAGPPWRIVEPYYALVRSELAARLLAALERIEIVRLSRPPPATPPEYVHVQAGVAMTLTASCPDDPTLAWVSSDAGDGCITRQAFATIQEVLGMIEKAESSDLVEVRPVPFEVTAVVLRGGGLLDLAKAPRLGTSPADRDAVTELLAALAAPAVSIRSGMATAPATGELRVTIAGGDDIVLELLQDAYVRRAGEDYGLQLSPATFAILQRDSSAYADRSVWTEEPSTIASIRIDRVTYARGAVIGEWTRAPAGAVDGARVEALVRALAELRRSPDVQPPSTAHVVELTVAEPTGPPRIRQLNVGSPRQGGCVSFTGTATVMLPAPVCASVTALAN